MSRLVKGQDSRLLATSNTGIESANCSNKTSSAAMSTVSRMCPVSSGFAMINSIATSHREHASVMYSSSFIVAYDTRNLCRISYVGPPQTRRVIVTLPTLNYNAHMNAKRFAILKCS